MTPSGAKINSGSIPINDFVDLPNVEVIRLQSAQRILELAHGNVLAASVRARLGHQDDLLAHTRESDTHALLRAAIVIIPGVIEEVYARVHGFADNARALILRGCEAEMPAADSQRGNLDACAAHRPMRNGTLQRAHFRR